MLRNTYMADFILLGTPSKLMYYVSELWWLSTFEDSLRSFLDDPPLEDATNPLQFRIDQYQSTQDENT